MTMNYYVVSPAYGRDYKDKILAQRDWIAGRDFVNETIGIGGHYCSIRDFDHNDLVEIRFNRKRELTMVRRQSS